LAIGISAAEKCGEFLGDGYYDGYLMLFVNVQLTVIPTARLWILWSCLIPVLMSDDSGSVQDVPQF
jgi:hypothetical protein